MEGSRLLCNINSSVYTGYKRELKEKLLIKDIKTVEQQYWNTITVSKLICALYKNRHIFGFPYEMFLKLTNGILVANKAMDIILKYTHLSSNNFISTQLQLGWIPTSDQIYKICCTNLSFASILINSQEVLNSQSDLYPLWFPILFDKIDITPDEFYDKRPITSNELISILTNFYKIKECGIYNDDDDDDDHSHYSKYNILKR